MPSKQVAVATKQSTSVLEATSVAFLLSVAMVATAAILDTFLLAIAVSST